MKSRGYILVLVMLTLLVVPAAHACEMCKDAVVTNGGSGGIDGSGASAGLNFNASVLYMLGGVFAVMGLIGRVMYKATRPR